MTDYIVRVVFDTETEPPEPIGVYLGTEEDTVSYMRPDESVSRRAPYDCVTIVDVTVSV